jgi:hypothetical protein
MNPSYDKQTILRVGFESALPQENYNHAYAHSAQSRCDQGATWGGGGISRHNFALELGSAPRNKVPRHPQIFIVGMQKNENSARILEQSMGLQPSRNRVLVLDRQAS